MKIHISLLALLLGCSGSDVMESVTSPPETAELASFAVVAGDNQRDTVGRTLPVDIATEARDRNGQPLEGIAVNFVVTTEGGGQPFASVVITDSLGRASTPWELGPRMGTHKMEARAVVDGEALAFDTVTAIADHGWLQVVNLRPGFSTTHPDSIWSESAPSGSDPLPGGWSPSWLRDGFGNPVTFMFLPSAGAHWSGTALVADSVASGTADIVVADSVIMTMDLDVRPNGIDGLLLELSL